MIPHNLSKARFTRDTGKFELVFPSTGYPHPGTKWCRVKDSELLSREARSPTACPASSRGGLFIFDGRLTQPFAESRPRCSLRVPFFVGGHEGKLGVGRIVMVPGHGRPSQRVRRACRVSRSIGQPHVTQCGGCGV